MKPNRREFLRLLTIGAGAAIAAPVLAFVPEPKIDVEALAEAYRLNVQEDLVKRMREGVYESIENSNYQSAMAAARKNPHWCTKEMLQLHPMPPAGVVHAAHAP
jgi:hypothetical protein